MLNLCHFALLIAGTEYPAHPTPLLFHPILDGDGPVKTLTGYEPPEGVPEIPEGTWVIIPRFAAAIRWALKARLNPFCIALADTGQRGGPNGGVVTLKSVKDLEPAPDYLDYDLPDSEITWGPKGEILLEVPGAIQRLVGGNFPIRVDGGPELAPVAAGMVSYPDGKVTYPPIRPDAMALLVPNDSACVRAAIKLQAGQAKAILVTSAVQDGKVNLYRVW